MANIKSTTSAQASETKQVYLDVLCKYNKSLNLVIDILDNVDNISSGIRINSSARAGARVERNRLINNWNDYVDATVQFLEVMDEDGEYGGQQEAYDATNNLFTENSSVFERMYSVFERMYKDLNDILDHKKKESTQERHQRILKKMAKEKEDKQNDVDRDITTCSIREINDIVQSSYIEIVELVNWVEDYANHVLMPKIILSNAQVAEVTNDIEERQWPRRKKICSTNTLTIKIRIFARYLRM
jgi:hypothetical protein